MIKQETIISATPIALNIPSTINLSEKIGSIIKGLNSSVVSMEGYDLDNITTKLAEETKDDSEHTLLLDSVSTEIAGVIRQSNYSIGKYIIPICNEIQHAISYAHTPDKIENDIFQDVLINYINIEPEIFDASFYPNTPSKVYNNGVLLTASNIDIGTLPERTGEELSSYVKGSLNIPELEPYLSDNELLSKAWNILNNKNLLNFLDFKSSDGQTVDLNKVNYDFNKFGVFVCASLIVNKLFSEEGPLEGTRGVTLEEYENHLSSLKEAFNQILYNYKIRAKSIIGRGVVILNDNTNYTLNDNEDSYFYKAKDLYGNITVGYTNAALDLFSNSDKYGLPEVILGMVISKKEGTNAIALTTPLTNLDLFTDVYNSYKNSLSNASLMNMKNLLKRRIDDKFIEIVKNKDIKEYLENLEGVNEKTPLNVRLKNLLLKEFDYNELLTNAIFIKNLNERGLKLFNTDFAVKLANALGAPIAARIIQISNNTPPCGCEKEQRMNVTKAIATVIIEKLMA